jgi:ferredoxin-type protein NapH
LSSFAEPPQWSPSDFSSADLMPSGGRRPWCAWSASALGKRRKTVQFLWTALSNGYLYGFAHGKIFSGRMKGICLPGLNCYSCPGAFGACPLGSLQSSLYGRQGILYVVGFLCLFGMVLGRFVCGWLCPFGLLQELIHKIPLGKKVKRLPGDKWLRKVKYVLLFLFVLILPFFLMDKPWFCAYVCPQGTLEGGVFLTLGVPALRSAVGWVYAWKVVILAAILVLSLFVYRPFCRYFCPLGVIYGSFNKLSILRYKVDTESCISCGACHKACPMDLDPSRKPNDALCVRCGACIDACPVKAISFQHSLR